LQNTQKVDIFACHKGMLEAESFQLQGLWPHEPLTTDNLRNPDCIYWHNSSYLDTPSERFLRMHLLHNPPRSFDFWLC